MTLAQVARKDFEDAVRSRMVWGVVGVFVGFTAFVMLAAMGTTDGGGATGDAALALTAQLSQLFVPLVGLIVGYMAIVGERRSGSLRVLLSYPHSRRDVVFGKLVGRSAVIAVALGIGSAASVLLAAVLVELPASRDVVGMVASLVLFGVSFTGLAVGLSASVRRRGTAMAAAIGSMLVFLLVWNAAAAGVHVVVTGSSPGVQAEAWYFLLKRLNPVGAFNALAETSLDGRLSHLFQMGLEDIPADATPEELELSNRVEGPLPWYLTNWFAGLTLVAWGLVPTVVGYVRFVRSDV
ncbi:MAG: ABC transporter permease subunit [Haloferacaceae archaeon]